MANRLGGSGEKSCKSGISQGRATVRFSTKTANFSSRAIAFEERPCASCTDVARDEMPDCDLAKITVKVRSDKRSPDV